MVNYSKYYEAFLWIIVCIVAAANCDDQVSKAIIVVGMYFPLRDLCLIVEEVEEK